MEIIEPDKKLIEYIEIVNKLDCKKDIDLEHFLINQEWHYVQSDLEKNIFLLKRLNDYGILPKEVNICDCGIGLGTVMFDLFLQSKSINDKKFTFTGIEKFRPYIDYVKLNLYEYWENNLELIEGDIMEFDYSTWNFIFFYQPFSKSDKAMSFYNKVINECISGTLILGLDPYNIMTYGSNYRGLVDGFKRLKPFKIDDWYLFQK